MRKSVRFLNENQIIEALMQSQLLRLDLELKLTDLIEMYKQKQRRLSALVVIFREFNYTSD